MEVEDIKNNLVENFHYQGVAVVIPVYNRAKILQKTLEYVLAQALLPDKLIIVDDGSTDDTAGQTEKWLSDNAKELNWEIIRKSKSTAAKARNVGFAQIGNAKYVAFLDSDDHWPEDFLERCVRLLDSKPDAVGATAERHYRVFSGKQQQDTGGMKMTLDPVKWLFKHGGGIASCSLLNSKVVTELGGWPEEPASEDTELFCTMSLKGPWLFAEGRPVVFNIGNASENQEEGNLSLKYEKRELRWVNRLEGIYEKIIRLDTSLNKGPLKKLIAVRWRRACKYHLKRSEWSEARSCIRRAIHWHPWCFKYWRHLIKIAFKR